MALALSFIIFQHAAIALKDRPWFDRECARRDVASDHGARRDFDSFMADDVAFHYPAHDADTDVDIRFDPRRGVHNQGAFLRDHFAGHVTVNAQQVFEAEFAVKFRFAPAVARTLFDRQRASRSSQLTVNDAIN